jgi:hypothetical protein
VVANASGTISGSVANVQISCPVPKFSVGGAVTGLVIGNGDTMELQDNAGDNLFVTGDVAFTFPTQFSFGTTYSVSQFLPPTSQTQACTIFFAKAVIVGNVSDVLVDCQHNDWGWVFPAAPALDQYGTASLPTYSGANPIPQPPFPAPNSNTPGGRDFAMAWTDKSGNRWLFGGFGFEVTHASTDGIPGYLNDMWVWPTTNPTSLDDDGLVAGRWIPSDCHYLWLRRTFRRYHGLQFKNRGANYGTQGSGTACALNVGGCTTPGGRWGGITDRRFRQPLDVRWLRFR